jgi:tol-pal system protein YbgF
MQIARATIRNRFIAGAVLAAFLSLAPVRAHAVSKEIIQLQTQVQQLLDMVQRIQSTLDTRFAVLQNLAQQTTDEANQMTAAVNTLQKKIDAQDAAMSGKLDTSSGQIQSLNDSVDELKARVAKLNKTIEELQSQLQSAQNPQPGGALMPGSTSTPPAGPNAGAAGTTGASGMPGADAAPAASQTPPLHETFQSALRDFNAARYPLAMGEFQDVVHYYPMDDMAGSAQFYMGEIAYRQKKYEDAIKSYNAVLEGFGGNAKAPAAQLHKSLALLKLDRRSSAIHEMRSLIQRYPQTPEAAQARESLNAMGVRINPR